MLLHHHHSSILHGLMLASNSRLRPFFASNLEYLYQYQCYSSRTNHSQLLKAPLAFTAKPLCDESFLFRYLTRGWHHEARNLLLQSFSGGDLHNRVVRWTSLLTNYARQGHVFKARMLFDVMPHRNIRTWNAMQSGYLQSGMLDEARRFFESMPERNVVSWTAMLGGYADAGRIEDARKMFGVMPEKNAVSWNSMVGGLVKNGHLEEARMVFEQTPCRNVVSWNVMIAGYAENGRMDEARTLFDLVECRNVITWTSMISGYCHAGNVEAAYSLFQTMPEKNVVSWTAIHSTSIISGTLVDLQVLVLRNNNLVGELPTTLRDYTSLLVLDVGENLLTGPIPKWIGKRLPQLNILSMRVNRFFGSVPPYLCYLQQIKVLDLSRNNLSEDIPTCLKNLTAMIERSTISSSEIGRGRGRKISSGVIYYNTYVSNVLLVWKSTEHVFWDLEILRSIDLSSNNLTGEIPEEVLYLVGLVSLNLSGNHFSGEIPFEIGNLTSLEFLDLSRNNLSGKIPSSLSQIDRLSMLNLSYNFLSGRIPFGRQFQTFDAYSFQGNLDLCGEQLNKTCPDDETKAKPQGVADDDDGDNSVFYEALYMSLGIGFFTGFWGLLGPILIWRPWRISYLRFLNRLAEY